MYTFQTARIVAKLGNFNVSLHSELPSFVKTPMDLTIRTRAMAKLECAAEGHPPPQISWQKDGGTDFPAARERRMHVMPEDDVFFIANVKIEDMGIYSCMAQNVAGGLSANATLTVLGNQIRVFIRCFEYHVHHWYCLLVYYFSLFRVQYNQKQASGLYPSFVHLCRM